MNNLKSEFKDVREILESGGIDAPRRAETLTLDEWEYLAKQKAGGEI
jgi:16S rRNA A1518/A1519 N6-dimethyltransferase RsmA/KsgA/DIM1 with predicted DNA glycosylase/AP lyase activity